MGCSRPQPQTDCKTHVTMVGEFIATATEAELQSMQFAEEDPDTWPA